MTTSSTSFTPFLSGAGQRARLDRAVQGPVLIVVRHVAQTFRRARGRLRVWNMRLDDRVYLASLRDFQLHEMGLTLDQRDGETKKPFWKA